MDNNKQSLRSNELKQSLPSKEVKQAKAQPAQMAAAPTPNPVPSVSSQQPTTSGGNKKIIIWLIGGVALIVLAFGGVYWYMSKKEAANAPATQTVVEKKQPSVTDTKDTIYEDLNSIDVQAADSDFTSIDADLTNL